MDGHDIDNRQGYSVFIFTLISLYLINIVVARRGIPKSARPDLDPWLWRNLVISWIHGLVCGVWSILCVYYHPEFIEDPVSFKSPLLYLMVAFSSGYFLYDTLDMVMNNKLLKHWEVTLHHIFVVPGFWYNWHAQTCIGFSLVALLAEINSFFLHSRKLLQISKVGFDSRLYRTCSHLNLITFLFCRIIPISFILYSTYVEILSGRDRLSMMYITSIAITMVIVAVINVILFWRLFKSDVIRPYLKKKQDQQEEQYKVNGNNNVLLKKQQ